MVFKEINVLLLCEMLAQCGGYLVVVRPVTAREQFSVFRAE